MTERNCLCSYVGNSDGEVRPSPMDYFRVSLEKENSDIQNGPNQSTMKEETSRLKLISMEQVSWHDRQDDCWIIICDYVYDCTEFIKKHPGGADVLLEYAGRDATLAFVGTGHSETAKQMLSRYIIGELPVNEKIFQRVGGIRIIQIHSTEKTWWIWIFIWSQFEWQFYDIFILRLWQRFVLVLW